MDPIEVRTEVIENDIQKAVGMEALQEGILAINAKIEKAVKAVPDYSIPDEAIAALSLKDAKRFEQDLSKMLAEADNERKAFKSAYNKPLNEIERRYKEAVEPVKALHERYKAQRIVKEQEAKDAKKAELQAHYEEFAELLAPVVPYERLHDPKWLNATTKMEKAKDELEAKVSRIAAEWDGLKALGLEFHEQAEAHFFNTLDLGAAVSYNAKLVEDRRKIEEMKAAMAQPEPEPETEPEPEPEPAYEPTPEPEPMPTYAPGPVYAPPAEESYPMVMVIDSCTVSQAKEIGRFCGSIGVTGVFKRGTLLDAYRREFANGCS